MNSKITVWLYLQAIDDTAQFILLLGNAGGDVEWIGACIHVGEFDRLRNGFLEKTRFDESNEKKMFLPLGRNKC